MRVASTAAATVGPETLVRDSGEVARPRRDMWSGVPDLIGRRVRALDPSIGTEGLALLRHVIDVLFL